MLNIKKIEVRDAFAIINEPIQKNLEKLKSAEKEKTTCRGCEN